LLAEIYHDVRRLVQMLLHQRDRPHPLTQGIETAAAGLGRGAAVEYLHRLASGLGQLRRAGRIGVTVEGDGTSLVEPRTANALGMIVAEVVAECLDATTETVTCGICR
jgi:two-component sensor histidine kinase